MRPEQQPFMEAGPESQVRRKPPSVDDSRLGDGDDALQRAKEHAEAVDDAITDVVERIVPQLVSMHRGDPLGHRASSDAPPSDAEVMHLAELAVAQDVPAALDVGAAARRSGRTVEWIMVQLIPAAARHLGREWEEDRRSFLDVTVGVGTLQILLRRFAPGEDLTTRPGLVVVTCPPREQHQLGCFVLGAWLQHEGFAVHVEPGMHEVDLVDMVDQEPVIAVGLSVSCAERAAELAPLCGSLRQASRGGDLELLLGGMAELEALAAELGAQYCCDAEEAARWLAQRFASSAH